MSRTSRDPALTALAAEAGSLPFAPVDPVASTRGLLFFSNGLGCYVYLRIRGFQFFLGKFRRDQLSEAQQYADVCRLWFGPYLRKRPAVESVMALYNFSPEHAQHLLDEYPAIRDLLTRIENHLQAEHEQGRMGIIRRDILAQMSDDYRKRNHSAVRQNAARLAGIESALEDFRASFSELSGIVGGLAGNIEKAYATIQGDAATASAASQRTDSRLEAIQATLQGAMPLLRAAAALRSSLDAETAAANLSRVATNSAGLCRAADVARHFGLPERRVNELFPPVPLSACCAAPVASREGVPYCSRCEKSV